MGIENLAPSTKTIRVSYCDPDATDSSSYEESDKSHENSKRKVHEIEVEFVQKNQGPRSDTGNFEEERGFKTPNPIREGEKIIGVRMMKTGKFGAEIPDPLNNKRLVCLGTFGTAEAASRAYLSKEYKFAAAKLRAKQRLEWASENSPFQDSVPSVLDSDNPNPTSAGKKMVGVRMMKGGKFGASIRDPYKKKIVWLGSFTTADEAYRAYLTEEAHLVAKKLRAKDARFVAKKLRAGRIIDPVASYSSTFQDSVSSVLGKDTSDMTSFEEGARTRISRVRRRSSAKCCSEIRNLITSSDMKNQATRAYLAKNAQFAANKSKPKRRIDRFASDKLTFQDSVSSVLDSDTSDLTSFQEGERTRISGFRTTNLGKFCEEIRDPITKRRVWLGTFGTTEQASRAYLAKKAQFAADQLRAKRRIDRVVSDNSTIQDSVSSFHEGGRTRISGVRRRKSGLRAKRRIDRVVSDNSTIQDSVSSFHEGGRTRISGVRRRKSGKFWAEITNPITKRRVWIGSFDTEEEASRAYLAKEAEFEDELRAKLGFGRVASEKSLAPDSVSSVLEIETSGLSNETGVALSAGDQQAEFGFFNGVQVVDKNGFLVGEFSMLDDFSIFSEEETANS